jgi:RES domain-containing protein
MIVYRLGKEMHKNDLSGKGAERSGARWNSKGHAVVYTSESRALCTTEIAVRTPLGNLPVDYFLTTIEIPSSVIILELSGADLPKDWKSIPHPNSTQTIGDKFIDDGKYAVMKVPSAVVQGDFNFLINPAHKLSGKIKITKTEPFEFDKRLFIKEK